MRGLLIVNPHATTTGGQTAKQVASSLAGLVDLDVEHTKYRGHARELAAAAREELVIVLGGDGAINEAVNGIMSAAGPGDPPLLAIIPGGGGNVLARGLGVPMDTAAAVARIGDVITAGRYRTIGLGLRRPVLHVQRQGSAWTPRWWGRWTGCGPRASGERVAVPGHDDALVLLELHRHARP